jgi:hypothetical protein
LVAVVKIDETNEGRGIRRPRVHAIGNPVPLVINVSPTPIMIGRVAPGLA